MKTIIKCTTAEDANRVYDALISEHEPISNEFSVLKGIKKYLNDHTQIPTMMEFDLTQEEAEVLKQLPGVESVHTRIHELKPKLFENWVSQTMKPRAVHSDGPEESVMPLLAPHSLVCSLCSEAVFSSDAPIAELSDEITTYFYDCSGVDIIVVDSGIDATHSEFIDSTTGDSRVVDFDWGVFQEVDPFTGDLQPIIPNWSSIRPYFLQDEIGHGTGCASLAAGNRCGIAKNAQLFSVKIFAGYNDNGEIDPIQALKCVLAFVNAKKTNQLGLDSTRPTIITNSWGYERYSMLTDDVYGLGSSSNQNVKALAKISNTALTKASQLAQAYLPGFLVGSEIVELDAYVRQIVAAGGHFLHAAGNDNAYADHSINTVNTYHFIDQNQVFYVIPSTPETDTFFNNVTANNFKYGESWFFDGDYGSYDVGTKRYYGKGDAGFYSSPGIGVSYSKNDYPVITVGDVTIAGPNGEWSSVAFAEPFLPDTDDKTLINSDVRQRAYEDRRYVKSWYSNFGPSVDVYATGNRTIAAKSVQLTESAYVSGGGGPNDLFRSFNGTSAATPIVAGILASYLAANPTATPASARDWLLKNSAKGNIVETSSTTQTYTDASGNEQTAFCPDLNYTKFWQAGWFQDDRDTFLSWAKFYNSANRVAQAFPLRNAVLNSNDSITTIGGVFLNQAETGLNVPETHIIGMDN